MKDRQLFQIDPDRLKLNNESAFFLHQAASWTKFIAIVGFIAIGIMLIFGIIVAASGTLVSTMMQTQGYGYPGMPNAGSAVGITYFVFILVYCAIMVIPLIYQLQFSSKIKRSLPSADSATLAEALRALKNYFVFNGILLIVALSMIVLFLLILMPIMAVAG